MTEMTNQELVQQYAKQRSEEAFAELVRRHVDLVYSAALRIVRDRHLAEDVTQSAFAAFAKSARQLTERKVLCGWLHRTTHNIACQMVRTDVRRRQREEQALAMNELNVIEKNELWEDIAPQLDIAIGNLDETSRDALLMRYFEGRSAREAAEILGISEEAAQKRIARSVEHLRELLSAPGAVTASVVVGLISAHAVKAAPLGLSASIAAGVASGSPATTAIIKTFIMTTAQKVIIGAVLIGASGAAIYEGVRASKLQAHTETLEQQRLSLGDEIRQLRTDLDRANGQLAAFGGKSDHAKAETTELLKLRNQVARLRETTRIPNPSPADPLEAASKDALTKVKQLKERLEQTPKLKIPELDLVSNEEWLEIGKHYFEDSQGTNLRRVCADLRRAGKEVLANRVGEALNSFIINNGGTLPAQISDLRPYLDSIITDDMLERYKTVRTGKLADVQKTDAIFLEKESVDQEDTLFSVRAYGWSWHGTGKLIVGEVEGKWNTSAIEAFASKSRE